MNIQHDFHNPDNLTPEQVGKDYRLLLKSEIRTRLLNKEINAWLHTPGKWSGHDDSVYEGSDRDITYRVPLATWPLPIIEPEWITWNGGECPLKDDEVEEWQYKINNSASHINTTLLPSRYDWRHIKDVNVEIAKILAYRVTKWKEKPSPSPDSTSPAWESLMGINAKLGKRVSELEVENQVSANTVNQAHLTIKEIQSERDYWKAAAKEQEKSLLSWPSDFGEIQAKLSAAQARLAQLEWRPISVKPTKEDADEQGWIRVITRGQYLGIQQYPSQSNVTHWRPCAPPEVIDRERVAFEKLWTYGEEYRLSKEEAFELFELAREAKP